VRALCLFAALIALTAAGSTDPTIVQTDRGSVHGSIVNGVRVFLGIPFAAPPVGPLRFNPPKPAPAWNGVRDALQAGPACPQIGPTTATTQDATEDCLYLNVWAPVGASKTPVYVFIHGGGFTQGNSALFDGSLLAATGKIIVVTVNYRLGILGFLANSSLDNGGATTGNYGIEDQQAALHWVQRNIGNFGGEPRNVTLGGVSAGAISTCANLAAPNSQGTFVRAIVESGPCAAPLPTLADLETRQASIPAQLGCPGSGAALAACLRSPDLSIQKILAVQRPLSLGVFFPSAEGDDIPAQPRTYLGRVPLLLGGNHLEAGYFLLHPPATEAAYEGTLQHDYGADAAAIAAQYPVTKYPSPGVALVTAETDSGPVPGLEAIAICADVASWRLARATGGYRPYAYEFNDPNAYASNGVRGPVHTAEIPYLFPNKVDATGKGLPPESQSLSKTMLAYWTNFVKTGDPNGPGLPNWPAFNLTTDVMQLAPGAVATGTDAGAEHKCPFWNSLGRSN
jgi:para-nitrobenzyl esterase